MGIKKTTIERLLDFIRPIFLVNRYGTGFRVIRHDDEKPLLNDPIETKLIQPWICELGIHYWSNWFGSIRLNNKDRCYLCGRRR